MFGNAHFSVCFDDGNYFLSAADHGAKDAVVVEELGEEARRELPQLVGA
ncbi:hypothetical protein LCGC14_2128690, partial [marine sediment metagenome]